MNDRDLIFSSRLAIDLEIEYNQYEDRVKGGTRCPKEGKNPKPVRRKPPNYL